MKQTLNLALALLLPAMLAAPAQASEVIFIGREIDLPKSFVCSGKTLRAGRYGLEVSWDGSAHQSKLKIFRGEEDICEVPGAQLSGNDMRTSKTRVLTKVNSEKKAIEIDMITPSGLRDQVPSQVFFLPLADKG